MNARPILFSPEMVLALLDGRKTQTRRVMTTQPTGELRPLSEWSQGLAAACHDHNPDPEKLAAHSERLKSKVFPFTTESGGLMSPTCPYGVPGDLLYVREPIIKTCVGVVYVADGHDRARIKATPSIHMPRAESRLTLRVTDVRVQRIQDISNEDAIAEGIGTPLDIRYAAFDGFRPLWDRINAERGHGWDTNPWVWALSFEVIKKNVDAYIFACGTGLQAAV